MGADNLLEMQRLVAASPELTAGFAALDAVMPQYIAGRNDVFPPSWARAIARALKLKAAGRRLYFVDREGTPWRVRPVYVAPPDWHITPRVPPYAREFYSRLFVSPTGKRRIYSPKYDPGVKYNPGDWSPATLERQLGRAGAPAR